MSFYDGKAPGIDFIEQVEEATKVGGISNAVGIVGVAKKGPLEATLLTSAHQCISIFGEPHANNSAIQGALACLNNSREVWFKRVISENAKKGSTWEEIPEDQLGEGETNEKPWAVFKTKELTDLCNGYSVKLTWVNEGTEAAPIWKIDYNYSNAAGTVVESYRCDEDAEGELYLGKIISLYSKHLEVEITGEPTREEVTYVISGGNSGIDATVDEIVGKDNSGMKAFYDTEAIDIATLIVPTWSDKKVWEEGIKIGEYRKDIVFIPSLPAGLTPSEVQALVTATGEYTAKGLQFDRTFVALYWPNGLKRNTTTGGYDIVDIAPYIAATYARSDSLSNVWTAPAGVKRGVIQGIDGLEYKTTKEERDTLYVDSINVNPVMEIRGHGITIMGARTSKIYKITDGNTALRYINIRRLCNYVRKVVLRESMYNLFDQNDYYTWNDWKMRLEPYFREIRDNRGLYDYEIVMDETTVSQEDVDNGRMPGLIRVAPIKPNEYIIINFVVAKDGTVSFNDEVEAV